jgi:Flp pilus assembly protein TadG
MASSTPEAPRARSVMRRCRDERGASTIEMVIIFPVTLFIVFGIVQVGVWYYASSVARAAAQQGAQATAVYDANSGDGTTTANQVLQQNGSSLLNSVTVTPSRTAHQATVTVTGKALDVIPFIPLKVTATATVPVEAFQLGQNRS